MVHTTRRPLARLALITATSNTSVRELIHVNTLVLSLITDSRRQQ